MRKGRTTITISQDIDSPGFGTESTMAGYTANLAAHMVRRFGGEFTVEAGSVLRSTVSTEREDGDEIEEYLLDLERGDGWLDLLPEPAAGV